MAGQIRAVHEGGRNCLNYLKRGWNIKEGRGNKDFKKGGKMGQRVGALKSKGRGAGTHFRTIKRFYVFTFSTMRIFQELTKET